MSPKILDKETIQARDHELIESAIVLLKEIGGASMTMDKFIARVPYSKGTVYQHFCNKEDLFTATCNYGLKQMIELFERVDEFVGNGRERIQAMCYAYYLHAVKDPAWFMMVMSIKTESLAQKTSEARLQEHEVIEEKLMELMSKELMRAMERGEFALPKNMNMLQVVFAIWSMCFGSMSFLMLHSDDCGKKAELDVFADTMNNLNILLDGFILQPLSSSFDYRASVERVAREIFPKESQELKAKQAKIEA